MSDCSSSPGSPFQEVERVASEVCLDERADAERSDAGASAAARRDPICLVGPSVDRTGRGDEWNKLINYSVQIERARFHVGVHVFAFYAAGKTYATTARQRRHFPQTLAGDLVEVIPTILALRVESPPSLIEEFGRQVMDWILTVPLSLFAIIQRWREIWMRRLLLGGGGGQLRRRREFIGAKERYEEKKNPRSNVNAAPIEQTSLKVKPQSPLSAKRAVRRLPSRGKRARPLI